MSARSDRHRPLLAGVQIQGGVRGERGIIYPSGIGTLTGLAEHEDGHLMLVTNAHVVSSLGETKNPVGTEVIYQDTTLTHVSEANRVSEGELAYVELADGLRQENIADVAASRLASGVLADFAMHNAGAHGNRRIIAGTAEPSVGTSLTMLGSVTGERTVEVTHTNLSTPVEGKGFVGIAAVNCGDAEVGDGDSGAPILLRVRDGVYRMVGIAFTRRKITWEEGDPYWQVLMFPARAAERALNITFGSQLRDLTLSAQSGFDASRYNPRKALADFSGNALPLESIVAHGAASNWLGNAIPNVTGSVIHRWWDVSFTPKVGATPAFASVSVRGGSDARSGFTAGSEWGFIVSVKRTTDSAWRQVLAGSDTLAAATYTSGTKAIAVANFKVTLADDEAEKYAEYFESFRKGDFEVHVEAAPRNRVPVAKAKVLSPAAVNVGDEVTLDATDSTDPDEDALTYAWEHVPEAGSDENRIPITNADEKRATFTAPSKPTTLAFTLTVQDPKGAVSKDTVDVPVYATGVDSLGTLPEGDTTRGGSWSSDIASVHRSGRYARYYVFRLDRRGKVRLSLKSTIDPYMFLLAGAGKNGRLLELNDDYDYPYNVNSHITRTLDAGDYTIEATTYWGGRTGDFELSARLMSNDATLSGLDLSTGELSPAFAAGEASYTASVEHAQNTITVTPTANHGSATITVKGVVTVSGTASAALPLVVGANTINVAITAEDGTQRTYSITVTRAVAPPPETWGEWSAWTETSETRGQCDAWEIKETRTRTSSRDNTQTQERWVTWEGPAETWGEWSPWSNTGRERGRYREREIERQRSRTSNRCRTQTETAWVSDPVAPPPPPPPPPPETWGEWSAWSDTGNTRGTDEYSEKEQSRSRTSSRGRTQTQTRWVPHSLHQAIRGASALQPAQLQRAHVARLKVGDAHRVVVGVGDVQLARRTRSRPHGSKNVASSPRAIRPCGRRSPDAEHRAAYSHGWRGPARLILLLYAVGNPQRAFVQRPGRWGAEGGRRPCPRRPRLRT